MRWRFLAQCRPRTRGTPYHPRLAFSQRTSSQRLDVRFTCGPKPGGPCPDRIGNIRRCQMTVVLLDHAGVAMTEIFCNNQERYAVHHGMARPSMAESVKID